MVISGTSSPSAIGGPRLWFKWFLAARPITLTASIVPVILADLWLRQTTGELGAAIQWYWSAIALIASCCIQIGTNLYNDVTDFQTGADSKDRVGPHRLVLSGVASLEQVRKVSHGCFLLALILGIPLVVKGGISILILGLCSICCGYGYSAPPLKLAYRGLSELFVVAFFGIFAFCGMSWIHNQPISADLVLIGITVGMLATNLLVVNNLRDIDGDVRANKLTLVARFGEGFGHLEFKICSLLAAGCYLVVAVHNLAWDLFLPLIAFLPLLIVSRLIKIRPQPKSALLLTALSHLLFGVLLGFILYNR